MKRKVIALTVVVALLSTAVAGSASAQATTTVSTGDVVEDVTLRPMDHDTVIGGGDDDDGSGGTCSISTMDHKAC